MGNVYAAFIFAIQMESTPHVDPSTQGPKNQFCNKDCIRNCNGKLLGVFSDLAGWLAGWLVAFGLSHLRAKMVPFTCKNGSIYVQKRFHLRANRFHLRANRFHLRAKEPRRKHYPCSVSCVYVQIWFHLRANLVHLRANRFHLRANRFHLRAKVVPYGAKPSLLRGCALTQTWPDIRSLTIAKP